MSKQKLTLKVGLVLMLLSSLVVSPLRANAGQAVIQGSSPDSSGITGDTFGPGNQGTPSPDGVSIGSDGSLFTSPTIRDRLNELALNLICRRRNAPSLVIIIIAGLDGAENAAPQVGTSFVNLGASANSVQELMRQIYGLCTCPRASLPGIPVGQLIPGQLVASVKELKAGSLISQEAGLLENVDVNRLSAAIKAYNQIVSESSPATLKKLSQDPNFLEIGRVLKELGSAVK